MPPPQLHDDQAALLNDITNIFPFYIRDDEHRLSDVEQIARELSPLEFSDSISIEKISGGITNELYKVQDCNSQSCALVRVYGLNSDIVIDRHTDNVVSAELGKLGLGPPYYGQCQNGRVEGFLPGLPIEPDQMGQREPADILSLIARELGRMHSLPVSFEKSAYETVWKRIEEWYEIAVKISFKDLPEKQAAYNTLDFTKILRYIELTQLKLKESHMVINADEADGLSFINEVVLAHNDLLSGNVLLTDDSRQVFFIDFEYSNSNTRAYDIANHWNEYGGFDCNFMDKYPTSDNQIAFLEHYVSSAKPELLENVENIAVCQRLEGMRKQINCYALASHLFWSVWAVIQARHSIVDFDYLNYARLRIKGFEDHWKRFISDTIM